jgi:D-alanyl-lipoteichoic acid acyltransferase DltB (MBOAT superfamily)
MPFISLEFALFLALGALAFHLARGVWRRLVLLLLSYAFYLTWNPRAALLLLAITLAVYVAAGALQKLSSARGKLVLLLLTVAVLLSILVFFKCAGLFARHYLTGAAGNALADILAPIGLSYYLFKLMGYLLDVYWEKIPVQRNFLSLALYPSFFPQILSGPIQRAGDFFSQLSQLDSQLPDNVVIGLRRILFGLFKKVVVADHLSAMVDAVHANPAGFSPLELLFGAYCFAFQIYADFSGVTDIAIGIGLLFGIKGPENFNLPFWARNIQEFWRRWHMSLTSWLTDYLFMPLRFSLRRFGEAGLCAAIFVTMFAVGIWHGPRLTYAAFGALNGLYMVVSALTLKKRNAWFQKRPMLARLRVVAGPLLTFHLMVFALILFRAGTLHAACLYITHLIPGLQSAGISPLRFDRALLHTRQIALLLAALGFAAMEVMNWASRQSVWTARFASVPPFVRWTAYYIVIVIIACSAQETRTFIYAQF